MKREAEEWIKIGEEELQAAEHLLEHYCTEWFVIMPSKLWRKF